MKGVTILANRQYRCYLSVRAEGSELRHCTQGTRWKGRGKTSIDTTYASWRKTCRINEITGRRSSKSLQ